MAERAKVTLFGLPVYTSKSNPYPWIVGRKRAMLQVHRIMASRKLGRELQSDEIVHHVDGDLWNWDEDNLEVMSRGQHERLHAEELAHKLGYIFGVERKCSVCGRIKPIDQFSKRYRRRTNPVFEKSSKCSKCMTFRRTTRRLLQKFRELMVAEIAQSMAPLRSMV